MLAPCNINCNSRKWLIVLWNLKTTRPLSGILGMVSFHLSQSYTYEYLTQTQRRSSECSPSRYDRWRSLQPEKIPHMSRDSASSYYQTLPEKETQNSTSTTAAQNHNGSVTARPLQLWSKPKLLPIPETCSVKSSHLCPWYSPFMLVYKIKYNLWRYYSCDTNPSLVY